LGRFAQGDQTGGVVVAEEAAEEEGLLILPQRVEEGKDPARIHASGEYIRPARAVENWYVLDVNVIHHIYFARA
jgi:hypothetical protein